MAWVPTNARDLKEIEGIVIDHKQGQKHHVQSYLEDRIVVPPPVFRPIVEVLYRPRPPRHDPSEPFELWHRNVRECSQWDHVHNRFLVSIFDGGIGAVPFTTPVCIGSDVHEHVLEPKAPTPCLTNVGLRIDYALNRAGSDVHEHVLVPKAPYPRLTNLGLRIDYARNRVICCVSDKFKYSLSTIVAYDYTMWKTLFVVKLQEGVDNPSIADDLALDPQGNIYVTDVYNGKIWKVKSDGSESSVFCDNPMFHTEAAEGQPFRWVKLNGIVYHPNGFLLVAHTSTDSLFKVSMDGKSVKRVRGLTRKLLGDGIVLLNKSMLVMAGLKAGIHILTSMDDWTTAIETHYSPLPSPSILATSVTLKDGLPFVGFANFPKVRPHNLIAQPTFYPIDPHSLGFHDFLRKMQDAPPISLS